MPRVVPRIRTLLRENRLPNHDDLRLRLRLLNRRLFPLVGPGVIVIIGISSKQNGHKSSLSAPAIMAELERRIARSPADRRQVREVESQPRHAGNGVKTKRICRWNKFRGNTPTRRYMNH